MLRKVFFILCLSLLIGCGKEKENEDKEMPVIAFSAPKGSLYYHNEDTVYIKFEVKDNIELKSICMDIYGELYENSHDEHEGHHQSDPVFSYNFSPVSNYAVMDTFYVISDTSHSVYTLNTKAVDKSGNTAVRDIYFHVNHH